MVAATTPRQRKQMPHAIPMLLKLTARDLYLDQGKSASQTAEAMDGLLTTSQVQSLARREGWVKLASRKASEKLAISTTRTQEQVEQTITTQARMSEHASLLSLHKASEAAKNGEALDKDAAQAFRAWAGGARDLVNVARQARGLDVSAQGAAQGGASLNMFFFAGSVAPAKAEPKPVEEGVPIDAQVIEAATVPEPAPVSTEPAK